jgi:hypothetical protein
MNSLHTNCHCLGMQINCQHRTATATVPLSGAASLTICVSFMTLASVTALVATPLLSPLVIGHGTLMIGMSIMPLLLSDHHYSPAPSFWVRGRSSPSCCIASIVYCLSQTAIYLPSLLLDDGYCSCIAIVSSYLLSCIPLRTGPLLLLFGDTILPSMYGSISSTCTFIGTL